VSGGYGQGGYPGYGEEPQRTRRRQGGYDGPAYGGQQYEGQQYEGQQYDDQAYGDYDGYGAPSYDQGGYQQGGYSQPASGYGQRRNAGYQQGGYQQGGYDQGGYDDGQRGDGFVPGFGGRGDYDDGYGDRRGPRGGRDGRGPNGANGPSGRGQDPRGRDDWDDRPRPRKKATRWLPRILVLTVVAVIVIGGLVGGLSVYHRYEARYHPADYAGPGTGEVTVQVMSGDTAFSLAPRLLSAGVIASTRAFTNAAEAATSTTSASSNGLEAGYYLLHSHMQASLAYSALLNPKNRVQTTVTIIEGTRAVDIIANLAKTTKIPLSDFQQVLAHPAQLGLPSYANGKAEGYLFPATYVIVPHETALQILQAMVQRFNVEAQAINIETAASLVHLTPAQLITEASLAQSEGGAVSDYPKIAEVINNRLARGMHLQFDSTVLYGLGKYAVSATFKQVNTPGPYNTYLNAGLPPGPISNPGDAAIKAIINADHGDYLYFLTVPHGKSQFSATPLKGQ
jgi:UPF0755 protein